MILEVEVAVHDARLSEIVDRYVGQFAGMDIPAITRIPIVLGGEPAEMLEVVPGREGSRDVFMLHDGTFYHFMFMPSVRDFAQAKNDVEELYSAVMQSFTFTSKKPRPIATPACLASPRDPGVSGVARWGTTPDPACHRRTAHWRLARESQRDAATRDDRSRRTLLHGQSTGGRLRDVRSVPGGRAGTLDVHAGAHRSRAGCGGHRRDAAAHGQIVAPQPDAQVWHCPR